MSIKNFKPLADWVLIEPDAMEVKTSGGLLLPDTAKEEPQSGKVVAIGKGKKDQSMEVKVGDHVLFAKFRHTKLPIQGKDYLIMHESDIYLVF